MKGIPVETPEPKETPDHKQKESSKDYPGKIPNPFVTTITHSVSHYSYFGFDFINFLLILLIVWLF